MERYNRVYKESNDFVKEVQLLGNGKAYLYVDKNNSMYSHYHNYQYTNAELIKFLNEGKQQENYTFVYQWPTTKEQFEKQLNLICKNGNFKIVKYTDNSVIVRK